MRNEAASGMSETVGEAVGEPGASVGASVGASMGESPRGTVRTARRRAAGPRPVRPAAAAPASRPVQPMRPACRTAPVAVVVPLFGEPARERVLGRPAVDVPQVRRGSVRESMQAAGWAPVRHEVAAAPLAGPVRRFLTGLALMVAVAATVVVLGLVAAVAGESRGGAADAGDTGTTIMVSPEGAAVSR